MRFLTSIFILFLFCVQLMAQHNDKQIITGSDFSALRQNLTEIKGSPVYVTVPGTQGEPVQVILRASNILPEGLQKKYPSIRAWQGHEVGKPSKKVRIEQSKDGWSLAWFTNQGRFWAKSGAERTFTHAKHYPKKAFFCRGTEMIAPQPQAQIRSNQLNFSQEITLRLALTTSYSFTQYHDGSKEKTLAALVTIVNRLNEVYEQELGVHFVLPEKQDTLIVTDPDEFDTGGSEDVVNQRFIDDRIGTENYDVGHILDVQSAGGYAYLGVVCREGEKARGYTGAPTGEGEFLTIDYLAHEIGHQFGAEHTFNGANGSCEFAIVPPNAVEPGSGSSIMAYAGICGSDNIQSSSDAFFHVRSAQQVRNLLGILEDIGDCGEISQVPHEAPIVLTVPEIQAIPAGTPIVLEADIVDPEDGLVVSSWDQVDNSSGQPITSLGLRGPTFRHQIPNQAGVQYFPSWPELVNNQLVPGNALPEGPRELNFTLFVRNPDTSGTRRVTESVKFQVLDTDPFAIQGEEEKVIYPVGSLQEVRWEKAGTNLSPISMKTVSLLMYDQLDPTFQIPLTDHMPNTGKGFFEVPDTSCPNGCRLVLRNPDRIFYAISPYEVEMDTQNAVALDVKAEVSTTSLCTSDTLLIPILGAGIALADSNEIEYQVSASEALDIQPIRGFLKRGLPDTLMITASRITEPIEDIIIEGIAFMEGLDSVRFDIRTSVNLPIREAPQAIYPIGGEVDLLPYDVAFNWSLIEEAQFYNVELYRGRDERVGSFSFDSSQIVFPRELVAGETYQWRVAGSNEKCGSGAFTELQYFSTKAWSCDTFTFNDRLSFGSVPFSSAVLEISENEEITDVNVLAIEGFYPGIQDLTFRLRSPSGPSIDLLRKSQDCPQSGLFTYRFDDAFLTESDSCFDRLPYLYYPDEQLATYRGQMSAGDWRLFVFHRSNSNGFVSRIAVEVCHNPAVVSTGNPVGNSSEWSIFPNPADDVLRFERMVYDGSTYLIRVFDAAGQEMVSDVSSDSAIALDIRSWPLGVYAYSIIRKDGNAVPVSGRFIKR